MTGNAIQVNDDANDQPIRVTLTAADGSVSLSTTPPAVLPHSMINVATLHGDNVALGRAEDRQVAQDRHPAAQSPAGRSHAGCHARF